MGSRSCRLLPLGFAVLVASASAHAEPSPAKAPAKAAPANKKSAPAAKAASGSVRAPNSTTAVVRQRVAGGPTADDIAAGADSPELRALREAERELFPPASPVLGSPWPEELPFPLAAPEDRPRVHASGLPPAPPASTPPASEDGVDRSWLADLEMPDIPVRWDPRVIRYLEFFKNDRRGRTTFTIWLRRSGRYRDLISKVFKQKGIPEDLAWLSMIESGFSPTIRSPAGALGLWQFMPATGKIYGLTHDRWADLRMRPEAATEAAAEFLADLHRRFGSWDLAMGAYNMGYGGMLSVVRRYNTNDFWALSKLEGAIPWETTLYVPKILAAAVVMKNLAAFGYKDVTPEPPLGGEDLRVRPGTALSQVARSCGVSTKELEELNPELRASRTPPGDEDWPVKVPAGKASVCSDAVAKGKTPPPSVERYVVRFGESLEQIAEARHVSVAKLVELNAITPGEVVRGGTVLLVPKLDPSETAKPEDAKSPEDKPVAVVPQDLFVYPDRQRVFYRVQIGDTVREVCESFQVTADEVRRWNTVDTSARLVEGMTLQLFVRRDFDLSRVVALAEDDVRTVIVGTEEFLHHWDERGRRRLLITVKDGDTLESIGQKHGVSPAMMERINRRSRKETLAEGDQVVVWTPPEKNKAASSAAATAQLNGVARRERADPTEPLSAPPAPDRLPSLP
jgi:membrane-bound lytic murein transglycosylase D